MHFLQAYCRVGNAEFTSENGTENIVLLPQTHEPLPSTLYLYFQLSILPTLHSQHYSKLLNEMKKFHSTEQ